MKNNLRASVRLHSLICAAIWDGNSCSYIKFISPLISELHQGRGEVGSTHTIFENCDSNNNINIGDYMSENVLKLYFLR